VYYLAVFPLAFFLSIAYNTSLYVLLALGALYLMRRGRWWAAGICGAVASGTRSAGILLAAVMLYEYLRQRQFRIRAVRADLLAVALVPAGLVAFSVYCWIRLGDPLRFSHAQGYWKRELEFPWEAFSRSLELFVPDPSLEQDAVHNFVDLSFGVFGVVMLILCVVGPWRLRADQFYLVLFAGLTLLLGLAFPAGYDNPLLSIGRFVLEMVPVFLVLAKMGASRVFERLYVMPALAMQAAKMIMLLNGVHAD
jgi:hypothetical protein